MGLACDAVNASRFTLGVFFLHVDFKCFLVLVMPVTLRTFEGFAGIPGHIPSESSYPRLIENEITIGAIHTSGPTVNMLGTSTDGRTLEHVGVGR